MLCNKAVAKQMMLKLLPPFYALYPVALRRLWQPPVHSLQASTGPGYSTRLGCMNYRERTGI